MASVEKTLTLCKFWLKKRCRAGEDCEFRHGDDQERAPRNVKLCSCQANGESSECSCQRAPRTAALHDDAVEAAQTLGGSLQTYCHKREAGLFDKTQLCKFWEKKGCSRGAGCKYAHGMEELRRVCAAMPCREYRNGACKLGSSCLFRHSDDATVQNDSAYSSTAAKVLATESGVAALSKPKESDEAADETARSDADAEERIKSVEGDDDQARAETQHLLTYGAKREAGLFVKTKLCKYWETSKCTLGTGCMYAHGVEEQRRVCATIPCKYRNGECPQGSECLFRHSEGTLVVADLEAVDPADAAESSIQRVPSVPYSPVLSTFSASSKDGQIEALSLGAAASRRDRCVSTHSTNASSSGDDFTSGTCKFWVAGRCRRADDCKFTHAIDGEASRDDSLVGSSNDVSWGLPGLEDDSVECGDLANRDSLRGELSRTLARARTQRKTKLCEFFMQSRCTREERCNFAHSEEEQREACQVVRCYHFDKGHCRQGDKCFYRHVGKGSLEDDAGLCPPDTESTGDDTHEVRVAAGLKMTPILTFRSRSPRCVNKKTWADLSSDSDGE